MILSIFLISMIYSNFQIICSDSVDVESHSLSTGSMPSETPRPLHKCRVRLSVNMSQQNDEIFINTVHTELI
jgi:hypothetical protein